MCVNANGMCMFCGRDYIDDFTVGMNCPSDDCSSVTDLVAVMDVDADMQFFCVEFNGEDYQAVFPEPLAEWSCNFVDHASCKTYLLHMAECLTRWQELGDVAVDDDDNLDQPFYDFPRGTDRIEVWLWFESEYSCSVERDLMPNAYASIRMYESEAEAA